MHLFYGMSIGAAAVFVLWETARPMTAVEIADSLTARGYPIVRVPPANAVRQGLSRRGDVELIAKGVWALKRPAATSRTATPLSPSMILRWPKNPCNSMSSNVF